MSGRHTSPRRSRQLTGARLARRQLASDPWVSVGLALLVGLVALLLTAVPRSLADVQGRQLVQEVDGLSATQRDVIGGWGRTVVFPTLSVVESGSQIGMAEQDWQAQLDDPWRPFREGAEELRAAQPVPLRDVLGSPQLLARLESEIGDRPPVETGFVAVTYSLAVDPALREHVELVSGKWPQVVVSGPMRDGAFPDRGAGPGRGAPDPSEILLSEDAARRLRLEVGDTVAGSMLLTGTYRPRDPEDPRWQHVDNAAALGVVPDADTGDKAYATAFLSPDNRGSTGQPASVRMTLWYPVDPAGISGRNGQVEQLRAQLTGFLGQEHQLADATTVPDTPAAQIPVFGAELTDTLDRVVLQQRATSSLLAVVAAGPLGVALAVAALGARLVVHRRRPALALTLARGASPRQLRWSIAAEGLLLGLPAALLGHLAATLLVPGPTPWWQWVVTALVGAVPALALAASLDDASLLHRRTDLSGRSGSRWRWVVEVAVLGVAALATWRLLDRGTRGEDASAGIDVLSATTPLLLALAASVVALRLYPLPLAALLRVLRRRPGLTPFLGAARSLRDPAGGLVPALAVVLGTAVALVSAVLLSTVSRGAEVAAWEGNGGQVRIHGPALTDELRAGLAAVDGVEAVSGLATTGTTSEVVAGGERAAVRVWQVDGELAKVLDDAPVAGLPPEVLDDAGPLSLVTVGSTRLGATEGITLGRLEGVRQVGHLDVLPGAPRSHGVVVSRARWEAAGLDAPLPSITLLALAEGADVDQVVTDVTEVLEGRGSVTTVAQRLDRFRGAPVTQGLTRAFVGATALSALLTVLAVLVVQLMGAGARARLLAVLRTLGLAPSQTRALTAWELAPLLLVSTAVGAALGLLVPWVLLHGLDLTGLTGGAGQPALVVDPLLVAAVLGGVLLTVLLTVTASARLAGRSNLAQAMRVGEER